MAEEKTKKFGADTPFERPAQPVEVAPLCVLLASEESSYITGEVLGATAGKDTDLKFTLSGVPPIEATEGLAYRKKGR